MKMYCVFSMEAIKAMGGNRGKMAAQAGHAYLHAWWDAEEKYNLTALAYRQSGKAKKVALVVVTTDELVAMHERLKARSVGLSLVEDAGMTVFGGPTVTCLGIGPVPDGWLDEQVNALQVLI